MSERTKNLYVIELDSVIHDIERRFQRANPDYCFERPCVYVGSTARTPQERYRQHLAGIRAGRRYVRDYPGQEGLMPGLYAHLNPVPADKAEDEERALAERLRAEGYGVWQN